MIRPPQKLGRAISAILFVLLICAQTIALAHTHQHEPVAFQDTACATCISLNQLETAAVDHGHYPSLQLTRPVICNDQKVVDTAAVVRAARQRGPPAQP
jgi:hypothetical protein